MPYGRGNPTSAPTPPGVGVGDFAQGQELYRQLLQGVEERVAWLAAFTITCPFLNTFLKQSPFGEKTVFFVDAAGGLGNSVTQTRAIPAGAFLGPARATIYVNGGGATSSTAARLVATRGADTGSVDFNPLNGAIIATSGAGTKAVATVQVDGSAWHEVSISFGNGSAAPSVTWTLFPQIAPSANGQIEYIAPGIMAMPSTATDPAEVPFIAWIPDTGGTGTAVAPAPQSQASVQGRLPALAHNPALLYKQTPDAYQIEGADLGRVLLPVAEGNNNFALPDTGIGSPDFARLPLGWFCYLDLSAIGGGTLNLFDPAATNVIQVNGAADQGVGTFGLFTSVSLEAVVRTSALYLLMLTGNDSGAGPAVRWLVQPVANVGRIEFGAGFSGTFTTPYGVREIYVTGAAGGGGGGGHNGALVSGGGGGAGQAVADFVFTATPNTSLTINVGTGGAAGAVNLPGAAGTLTQIGGLILSPGQGGESTGGGGFAFNGGAEGGFGAQAGAAAIGNFPGDGGGNIAGGIGSRCYERAAGLYSAPVRGGGGAGGAVFPGIDGTAGADGFLILRW